MHALVFQNNVVVVHEYVKRYFEYFTNVVYGLGVMLPDELPSLPLQLDDDFRILSVNVGGIPNYNSKIQYVTGPHYQVIEDIVVGAYRVEDKNIDLVKNELKEKAAANRSEKEEGGFTLPNGMKMKTDQVSQAKISGAYNFLQLKNNAEIDWKAGNGWVKLKKAEIEASAQAVAEYVQACFSRERQISEAIDACTTLEQLDAVDLTFNF
jgi:hypothetical protein